MPFPCVIAAGKREGKFSHPNKGTTPPPERCWAHGKRLGETRGRGDQAYLPPFVTPAGGEEYHEP